ncbi:cyclin-domain-containing protein, partial [Pyronema domesticum]
PPSPSTVAKRQRKTSDTGVKVLPKLYQSTHTKDLVILISDMLGELVGLNDRIPLSGAGLTRFHSRAPPSISITDYLHRLSVHASLQPSILLSMVYYIDILSTHYPPFVVSSLTVHRFLITAATVATKGLCDTFLTNSLYARIGGLSLMELNMLELEFLVRVGWRIVPKAEVLEEYYRSLV